MATQLDAQVDELRQRYNLDTEGINSILDPLLEQYRNSFTIDLLEKQLRFMESTGQLVTKTTKEAEAAKKIDNNIDTESREYEGWKEPHADTKFPFPACKEALEDKKYRYDTLLDITIASNKNKGDVKNMEFTNYVYEDRLHNELEYTNKLRVKDGKKAKDTRTVQRHIKYMKDCGLDFIDKKTTSDGAVYYVLRASKDDSPYVTIPYCQLKELITFTNKNILKLLVFLKYQCRKCKAGEFKPMDRAYIAKGIGLAYKYNKSLDDITIMVKGLAKLGMIEIMETIKKDIVNGKEQVKTVYSYRICTLEEYKIKDAEAIIRRKAKK